MNGLMTNAMCYAAQTAVNLACGAPQEVAPPPAAEEATSTFDQMRIIGAVCVLAYVVIKNIKIPAAGPQQ